MFENAKLKAIDSPLFLVRYSRLGIADLNPVLDEGSPTTGGGYFSAILLIEVLAVKFYVDSLLQKY